MLLNNNVAFVCFRKPADVDISIFVFSEPDIHILSDYNFLDSFSGFIFHPFDVNKNKQALLLKPKFQFTTKDTLAFIEKNIKAISFKNKINQDGDAEFSSTSRNDYFEQINEMIRALKEGNLKKVVLSRCEFNPSITIDKAPEIFKILENKYKNAFVYFLNIPGQSSWLGASPELFYKQENEYCKTVALAATMLNTGQAEFKWGNKERIEQSLVSEYLEDVFSRNKIFSYKKNGPFTVAAGDLFHLKTEFDFPYKSVRGKLGKLLKQLHATPAVCGLPKSNALKLIDETENYDREYYSGFLGVINYNNESHLYVNLRCLKFVNNGIALYTGGGITADSVPEKEWQETVHKAQTLLSVIEKIQTLAGN